MSYIVLFLLIISRYVVLGVPIRQDSLQFELVKCVTDENGISSTYILQITNVNKTCIKFNNSSLGENEFYLYASPDTTDGAQFHIKTENCSTPLPHFHLTLCNDNLNQNSTEFMGTFQYSNITNIDIFPISNDENENNNSTMETFLYTDQNVYETLDNLQQDSNEEHINITIASSINLNQTQQNSSEDNFN